jgi:hypothetical protein
MTVRWQMDREKMRVKNRRVSKEQQTIKKWAKN